MMNLRYYCYLRREWTLEKGNVGDLLTPVLLKGFFGLHPVYDGGGSGRLIGVGSIISKVSDGDVVWGSGLIKDMKIPFKRGLTFLAVRGPLTKSHLMDSGYKTVPDLFGDPAILMPKIFLPVGVKKYNLGIIPHYVDYESFSDRQYPESVTVINVLNEPRRFIEQMFACDKIVSSSLHGIILAEAYGIPAFRLKPVNPVIGGNFKYEDWYQSTGRTATCSLVDDPLEVLSPSFHFDPGISSRLDAMGIALERVFRDWILRRQVVLQHSHVEKTLEWLRLFSAKTRSSN